MSEIREIENILSDGYAILGLRNAATAPLAIDKVNGIRCARLNGKFSLLMPFAQDPFDAIKIGGIKIEHTISLIGTYGIPLEGSYIIFTCLRSHLRDPFIRIMADMIYDQEDDFDLQKIIDRLESWRILLATSEIEPNIVGLFGELYFLLKVIEAGKGQVYDWTGPTGATKDFQFSNKRVELKSTVLRNSTKVRMNGIFQSALPVDNDFLVHVRLEKDRSGDRLMDLAFEIENRIDDTSKQHFRYLLSLINADITASNDHWKVLEARVFKMDENFPAIRPSDFIRGTTPNLTSQLSYLSDISGCSSISMERWISEQI